MTTDFPIEPGLTFGEWLRTEVEQAAFVERNGFFPEQVARVAERLQEDRPPEHRFEVVVPWFRIRTAFTAPGRYVYFSRGLLERCPHDEAVAFVIAHEIAHHDLGHLDMFRGPFARHAARMRGGKLLVLFFRLLRKRIYSPQWECDADRRAIEMCVRAGYDGSKCLYLFHILSLLSLDAGDIDGVYGLDQESDQELSPEADLLTRARIRLYHLRRGYLPIQDREALIREHLKALGGPPEEGETRQPV